MVHPYQNPSGLLDFGRNNPSSHTHTPSQHTPFQHTLSTHCSITHTTLSPRLVNNPSGLLDFGRITFTLSQYTISTHPINTPPSQYALSLTHPVFMVHPYHHALSQQPSGLLDFGRKFIEDEEFLKKPINGDKDIFRFAHLIFGEAFYYVPHIPGYSFSGSMRDCIVHFFGGDEMSKAYQPTISTATISTRTVSTPTVSTRTPTATHPVMKTQFQTQSQSQTQIQSQSKSKSNEGNVNHHHHRNQQRQRTTLAKTSGRIERTGEPTNISPKATAAASASTATGTASASASPSSRAASPSTGASTGASARATTGTASASPGPHATSPGPRTDVARPMFFHQLKTRDPTAFNQLLRVPVSDHTHPH